LRSQNRILHLFLSTILFLAAATVGAADGKLMIGTKTKREIKPGEVNHVVHRCLTPPASELIKFPVTRDKPWSLPDKALAASYQRDINILVLRFNFAYEDVDDPTTTGRGHMDLSDDSAAFYNTYGHYIDPPPRDSLYFDAHVRALGEYYNKVSEGKVNITWKIFPPGIDSVYQLPNEMAHYGACYDELPPDVAFDSIIAGLQRFFVDCIQLADSTEPAINFADYESIFLFHAGADQQNNIGFPPTCRDLFTGYINFGDSIVSEYGDVFVDGIPVDGGADTVRTALLMPETASQDNRATALNAVLAHEFGHQLGLVDMYRTGSFRTQLGDFALMDNNGFGTGIDFGFPAGSVFGVNPVYPCGWSRAYLGFVDVVDYRRGSDIRLVAAEAVSTGVKLVRVPISDDEYYLIENRNLDIDGKDTYIIADPVTSVIQGPGDATRTLTGEYDHLLPGSGVIIYHVDESVARMDINGNGRNNFYDNQLQLDADRRFVSIVEADGIVDFGGYYNRGYGSQDDLFREDGNNDFTPNTNPPSFDNTGNNTHIYITNIRRDTALVDFQLQPLDSVVKFDLITDGLVDSFPVRCGYRFPPGVLGGLIDTATGDTTAVFFKRLSSIADDLDRDGVDEIITASDYAVLAFTTSGDNFIHIYTACSPCSTYYDTAHSRFDGLEINYIDSALYGREEAYEIPLYFATPNLITAGPATGDFGEADSTRLVAAGFVLDAATGGVGVHKLADVDADGQADELFTLITDGWPAAVSFGDILHVLTYDGLVYAKRGYDFSQPDSIQLPADSIYRMCRLNDGVIIQAGDAVDTRLYYYRNADTISYSLGGHYNIGPILVDLDRDSLPEIVAISTEGDLIYVTVDTTGSAGLNVRFSTLLQISSGLAFTTQPVVGDIDLDGYPDIIIGGIGQLYAFDQRGQSKTDFPLEIDDRFAQDFVFTPPVIADIESGGSPEIIAPMFDGNIYSFGAGPTYGFPLSGGERCNGSPLVVSDSTGGKLGFVGDDGWFYLWDWWAADFDRSTSFWPMAGADPEASFAFDQAKLAAPATFASMLPEEKYFSYPNPVTDGTTNIRYFLGEEAQSVMLTIYDLSGKEVTSLSGSIWQGVNDQIWQCDDVTPGVYRCVIEVDFGGQTENAFTDIAVIR